MPVGLIGQALGSKDTPQNYQPIFTEKQRSIIEPEYDWSFSTTAQEHANGRQVPMFRGKVLGGTAALNYMAFTR